MSDHQAERDALSPDEHNKARSRYLRGSIVEGLADEATGAVSEADTKLLKFHGTYQQDDRDLRVERLHQKLEPAYEFMVRVRMPGGVCSPQQWLDLDRIATERTSGTLRITSRQTFQLHGVLKRDLKPVIAGINQTLLSTLAACGDVNRNVVCHNHPALSPMHAAIYADAAAIADALSPQTRAYHEIWLDGEQVAGTAADARIESEPLYGATYLPRKFKIGLAVPPSNDIDIFSQDIGFIAIVEQGEFVGYNVAVGGGMGMSHGEPRTYPRLGNVIGYCPRERSIEVARAILELQRDHGNRSDRKRARLKYTIDDHGLEWLRGGLAERLGTPLEAARPYTFDSTGDLLGWQQDLRGSWHLTLDVLSGRIRDDESQQLLSALREIARIHHGDFRLTANQNVAISGIANEATEAIQAILDAHSVPDPRAGSKLRQAAMSCVAFPTCALAMAESERALPGLLGRLEPVLAAAGVSDETIKLRMTGCPNGCARPYLAEIGLVGKALDRYNLYLGGDFAGERLNAIYAENLSEDTVIETLAPMLERYGAERHPGEHFGDFVVRAGYVSPPAEGRDFNVPPAAPDTD